MKHDFEFYETPRAFTRFLFDVVNIKGRRFEPCVGSGAIVGGGEDESGRRWVTNDLDPRWPADYHLDATSDEVWDRVGPVDWTVTNPPFSPAIEIIEQALEHSRVGVAMHLRASINEVLKTGKRRTFLRDHTPTGTLWLPRFAYQRSPTTGKWTTDSMCACWLVWLKDAREEQFIVYASERVLDELDAETPTFRARMDALMTARVA